MLDESNDFLGTRFAPDFDLVALRMEQFAAAVEDFAGACASAGSSEVGVTAANARAARDELLEPYNLMVAGVQNAGKSTLLNVLLGRDLLPTSMKNVDAVLSVIEYGEEERAEIVQKNGERLSASLDEVLALIDQRESAFESRRSNVDYCVIYLPNQNLRTFRLVNTPGLEDRPEITVRTKEFFARADAVLWVFDATRIAQLQIASAVLTVVREHSHRVLAVLNKWDRVSRSGLEAENEVRDCFRGIFRGCYTHEFTFVARDAERGLNLKGQNNNSAEERRELLEQSGYLALIDHFEANYFGKEKQREKIEGAERKLDGLVRQAREIANVLAENARANIGEHDLGLSELEQIRQRVLRNRTSVSRKLRSVAEEHTTILIDAYLRASEIAGREVLGMLSMFKGGKALGDEFERRMNEEVGRILPKETFESGLERASNNLILEAWMDFLDEVDGEFHLELSIKTVAPSIGAVNISRGPIGRVLLQVMKVAVQQAIKVAGERLARSGLKRAIQKAVRAVAAAIGKIIGKKVAAKFLKELAKKLNPLLWLTSILDVKKAHAEINEALDAARADVKLEIASQRSSLELQIWDAICGMNSQIANALDETLQSTQSDTKSVAAADYATLDEVDKFIGRLDAIMGIRSDEPSFSSKGSRADDFLGGVDE